MTDFFSGATGMACLVAAAFFFRFYRDTHDRLFLVFGIAFGVFAVNRMILTALEEGHEATTWVYTSRLIAFGLILVAIIDKNTSSKDRT
ncbi:MAG TPA: DUF5985 family protein [Actinomycetota bacterium]|nr:DUF5985 family protein [Actinomycetota bacterium]